MVIHVETNDSLKNIYQMEQSTSKNDLNYNVNTDLGKKDDDDEFFDASAQPSSLKVPDNEETLNEEFPESNRQEAPSVNYKDRKKDVGGMMFDKNDLTQFIVMQLELIGHQQLQIQQKDKKIISLKTEKEQLEAKLSRMERRISIQKRHSLELTSSAQDENIAMTRSKVGSPSVKSPLVNTFTQKKASSEATTLDKTNMAPVTITSCNDKGFSFENFLRTNVTYSDPPFKKKLCKNFAPKKQVEKLEKKVPVPPWRILEKNWPIEIVEKDEINEDISDAAYERRHSKPEQEEKRRKRWDLQQARQQRQHEQLVQRYNEREQKSKLLNSSSSDTHSNSLKLNTTDQLARNSNQLHAVDVTEIVPVCAFGYPLPALAPRELDIPWFSIAKREVQLRTAKQRQVNKAKKRIKSNIVTHRRRKSKY